MIYFDNSATTTIKPKCVIDAVNFSIKNLTANPGRSGHKMSSLVAEKIFETREKLKDFLNAKNYSVVFTKNCTEALNIAILGLLKSGDHVIATAYEHNSVLRTLESLKNKGVEYTILDCDLSEVHLNLEKQIKQNTKLIITTQVSNVTGEVCDVEKVGKICKKHNIFYLVDGAQSCGHMVVDIEKSRADLFTIAGHKGFRSLTGVGALIVKNGVKLKPILYGGTGTDSLNLIQPTDIPDGFEAGTLSTISILSLNAGIDFLNKNLYKIIEKEHILSQNLYKNLKKLKFLEIYSNSSSQNVFAFNIKNKDSSVVANILSDKFNICVRSGLHCAPLIHKRLKTDVGGAVRVSLDYTNTLEEIDRLIKALIYINNF